MNPFNINQQKKHREVYKGEGMKSLLEAQMKRYGYQIKKLSCKSHIFQTKNSHLSLYLFFTTLKATKLIWIPNCMNE